jgi:hypothetical protein
VLYVSRLRNNLISVLVMEDTGFVIIIQREKILICPEGAILDKQ